MCIRDRCITAGHHAVKQIYAAGNCLNDIAGGANAHQVADLILGHVDCPVVSNNSANRFTPDVPMVVPEDVYKRQLHPAH